MTPPTPKRPNSSWLSRWWILVLLIGVFSFNGCIIVDHDHWHHDGWHHDGGHWHRW